MKNKKSKLVFSFSLLIICFLLSTSTITPFNVKALIEKNDNQSTTDSFDFSTWEWNLTETISTESTSDSRHPSLAIDTLGNVHLVWQDLTNYDGAGGDWDIFYRRFDSSISSWLTLEIVSNDSTGSSGAPSIAADLAGNVHVAWHDLTNYNSAGTDWDVFYKRWEATSSSWTTTEVISTESTNHSYYPSIGVDSTGNIHIAWFDETNLAGSGTDWDIFYKRWDILTSSWTSTEVLSTDSTLTSNSPALAVDPVGNINVAWNDLTPYSGCGGDWDIFYKHFDSSSSSWGTTEVVSTESDDISENPSLAVDSSGNVHIAWTDDTSYHSSDLWDDADIFYKRRTLSSSSWSLTELVSTESTSDLTYTCSLGVDSYGNVHCAWEDYTPVDGDGGIEYKRFDVSSDWTTTELVSTESTVPVFDIHQPSLAVDSAGNVHIVWWEEGEFYSETGEDDDIFYKLLAGPVAIAPELAFIIPNPLEPNNVYLNWNNVIGASSYFVYRSSSYIWSLEDLVPIATVSSSEYFDFVPLEGFYYYVVVAGNYVGNGSYSNCQYIEVKFSDLEAPELSFVLPNPTEIDSISLVWNNIDDAIEYYVYRSDTYIWSVEGLTPIATIGSNSYIDTLPDEGFYFYVIVVNDGARNSTHSNCEYIQYKLPTLQEFTIVSSLILGTFVVLLVVMRIRKKKSKMN